MRELLFVAYDFPPTNNRGGSIRSAAFARHLPALGWDPRVIARDEGKIGSDTLRRVRSLTPWCWPYQMTPYGWAGPARRSAEDWDRSKRFNALYVSCPPFPQALSIAASRQLRDRPLIVDFRDSWSLDPYQEGSRLKRWVYRHQVPKLEARLLERIDALIVNTPSALDAYRRRYPHVAERIHWIPNGFDEEDFADLAPEKPIAQGAPFTLLHLGRFGIGGRDPQTLFEAIARIGQRGARVALRVVGDQPEWVRQRLVDSGAEPWVSLIPGMAHRDGLRELFNADALVLMQMPGSGQVQAVAGKTFEYLRSGRPILAITPEGDNLDLVRRYSANHETVLVPDTAAIASAIQALLDRGRQQHQPDPAFLLKYQRSNLSSALAGLLNRVVR